MGADGTAIDAGIVETFHDYETFQQFHTLVEQTAENTIDPAIADEYDDVLSCAAAADYVEEAGDTYRITPVGYLANVRYEEDADAFKAAFETDDPAVLSASADDTIDETELSVLVSGFLNGKSVKEICNQHNLPYQETLTRIDEAYVEQGLIETEGERRWKTYIPKPAAFEALGHDVTAEIAAALQTAQTTGGALETYLEEQDLDALQEQLASTDEEEPATTAFTDKTWTAILAAGEVFGTEGSMAAFQDALDVSYPTAKKRRDVLEEEGLIYTEQQGEYHLTPAMRELLEEYDDHHELDPDAFNYVAPEASEQMVDETVSADHPETANTTSQTGDTAAQVEAVRSDLKDEGLLPDEENESDNDPLLAEDGTTAMEQDQQYREQAGGQDIADPAQSEHGADEEAPIHERLGHLVEGATIEWEQEDNPGIASRDLTDRDMDDVGADDGLEEGDMDFLDELDDDNAGYEGFT